MDQIKIGKFISENRKKQNLTQEQLAEKLNVSKNAVSKWERGLNLPDVSNMQDLCNILHITLNELFNGDEIDDNEYKKRIHIFSGKSITVRFDRPVALQIDGETIKNVSEYTCEC